MRKSILVLVFLAIMAVVASKAEARNGLVLGDTVTCESVQNHFPIGQTDTFSYGDQVWVHTTVTNLCTKGEFKYKWTLPDGTTNESEVKTFDPRPDCWVGLKIYDTYIGLPAGTITIDLYSRLSGETDFIKEITLAVTVQMTETYIVGDLIACKSIVAHQPVDPTTSFVYGGRVNVHQSLDKICVKTDFKFVYTLPNGASEESGLKTLNPENYCWTEGVGVYDYRDGLPLGETTVEVFAKTDTDADFTKIGSVTITVSTSITYELGDLIACAEIVNHQPVNPITSFTYGDRVNIHQSLDKICVKTDFKFVYTLPNGASEESGLKTLNPENYCWTEGVGVYDYRDGLPLGETIVTVFAKTDTDTEFTEIGSVTVTVSTTVTYELGNLVACKSIADHQPVDPTTSFVYGDRVNIHQTLSLICAETTFKFVYNYSDGEVVESVEKVVNPGAECWSNVGVYDYREDLPLGRSVIELHVKVDGVAYEKKGEVTVTVTAPTDLTLGEIVACKSIVDHQPVDVISSFQSGETVNIHTTIEQVCIKTWFYYEFTLPDASVREGGVKEVDSGPYCWSDLAIYDSQADLPDGTIGIKLFVKKNGESSYTEEKYIEVVVGSETPSTYEYHGTKLLVYDSATNTVGRQTTVFKPGQEVRARIGFGEVCGVNKIKASLVNGDEVVDEFSANIYRTYCLPAEIDIDYPGLVKGNYSLEISMSADGGDTFTLIDNKNFSVRDAVNIVPIINLLLLQE